MIDGKYQTWTTKEVKRYQKNHRLKITGTVNDQTAKKTRNNLKNWEKKNSSKTSPFIY